MTRDLPALAGWAAVTVKRTTAETHFKGQTVSMTSRAHVQAHIQAYTFFRFSHQRTKAIEARNAVKQVVPNRNRNRNDINIWFDRRHKNVIFLMTVTTMTPVTSSCGAKQERMADSHPFVGKKFKMHFEGSHKICKKYSKKIYKNYLKDLVFSTVIVYLI